MAAGLSWTNGKEEGLQMAPHPKKHICSKKLATMEDQYSSDIPELFTLQPFPQQTQVSWIWTCIQIINSSDDYMN